MMLHIVFNHFLFSLLSWDLGMPLRTGFLAGFGKRLPSNRQEKGTALLLLAVWLWL